MTTFELSSFPTYGRFLFWARLRSLVYIQIIQTILKSIFINIQTQMFQLNMTFVHRQRNQIQSQPLLTDGTSQNMSFLRRLCKRLHKCQRAVESIQD